MTAAIRVPELLTVISGLTLYAWLLWFLNRRFLQKLDLVFSRHRMDTPGPEDIRKTLDDLNLDSAHFAFTMERHANILFRRQALTLIYGRVGTRSPGGIRGPVWSLRKTVYACAENSQKAWMEKNSDAFTFAMSGYRYSAHWVNLDTLVAG